MAYTLEAFCKDCHDALAADPGPGGREWIRQQLERLLENQAFIEAHLGPDAEIGRHTLYQDPEFNFVVLSHVNDSAHKSPPHDHGESWAVYGQASAHTDMTEYRRIDAGEGAAAAEFEVVRNYRLMPGKAGLYDVGQIHAIDYTENARFVRVNGTDLETVPRLKYDLATKQAAVIESASAG